MQSIMGALLTAGYAAAVAAAVAASPNQQQITSNTESQLQKSFSGAESIAQQYPKHASQITQAAKSAFIQGDQWAYLAGITAILLGGALVFFLFPTKDREIELLSQYESADRSRSPVPVTANDRGRSQQA